MRFKNRGKQCSWVWVGCLAVLLSAGSGWTAESGTETQTAQPPKLLVLTYSGGFNHSCLPVFEQTIADLAKDSSAFQAVTLKQYELKPNQIDLSFMTAEYLAQFQALVLFHTTGPLEATLMTPARREIFLDYVKNGGGVIGVHTATDSYYQWPEYVDLIGGSFAGHPWGAGDPAVTIKVDDPSHPATRMLGPEWVIQDEIYQFKVPPSRAKYHRLLTLDNAKSDMKKQGLAHGPDGDYAVSWCRTYGKGRVFYTSLGHREDVHTNPVYRQHLLGGIKWVLGTAPWEPPPAADAPQDADPEQP